MSGRAPTLRADQEVARILAESDLAEELYPQVLAAMGGSPDFSKLDFKINESTFLYGHFVNALVAFVILAAVLSRTARRPRRTRPPPRRRPSPPRFKLRGGAPAARGAAP